MEENLSYPVIDHKQAETLMTAFHMIKDGIETDQRKIDAHIYLILNNINFMLKKLYNDKRLYLAYKTRYALLSLLPIVRENGLLLGLKEEIANSIDQTNFAIDTLEKLRSYAKRRMHDKNYDGLPIIFGSILLISNMYNQGRERLFEIISIEDFARKGINYIPSIDLEDTFQDFKEVIEEGIKSLEKTKKQ